MSLMRVEKGSRKKTGYIKPVRGESYNDTDDAYEKIEIDKKTSTEGYQRFAEIIRFIIKTRQLELQIMILLDGFISERII